jgi:TolB protein
MTHILRVFGALILILFCAPFSSQSVEAQTDIFVRGSGQLYPIALPQLCLQRGDSEAVKEIPKVIGKNLDISGYFKVLNQNTYIESPGKCDPTTFAYSDWSVIGAEGLVKGVVEARGSNVTVQMYLHDVQRRKVVLGKEYEGHISQVRKIAHRFANEIMRFFTGEPGVFGTRIAFSSKIGRFKELFVMEMDGSNLRQLTNERGLAMSADWSPDGERLVYTSYRNRVPDLFVFEIESRRIGQLTNNRLLELGASFSPDGQYLASISQGRHADIVLMDRSGKTTRQLTRSSGIIDVSPDWSPDYKHIVFTSNRSGGPQIYTMDATGRGVRRISFATSNYCTSPSWSPKGDRIAYVCRADRGFQIFTSKPDGSGALQLTSYGSNEDPTWSPDGNFIAFSSTLGKGSIYHIALMRADGTNLKQITHGRTSDMHPAWGPLDL